MTMKPGSKKQFRQPIIAFILGNYLATRFDSDCADLPPNPS